MIGDHIRTLKAGRWTHAIDCGDETVIVLAEDAARAPRIRRSYRPEFVAGADTVEVVLHRERTFPAEQVVARAYSRVSDPALASTFRDSEAFAEWCITGRIPATPPNAAMSVPGVALPAAMPAPGSVPSSPRPPTVKARPSAKAVRKGKPVRQAKATAKAVRKAKPARKPRPAPRKAAKAGARGAPRKAARKPARRGARR